MTDDQQQLDAPESLALGRAWDYQRKAQRMQVIDIRSDVGVQEHWNPSGLLKGEGQMRRFHAKSSGTCDRDGNMSQLNNTIPRGGGLSVVQGMTIECICAPLPH